MEVTDFETALLNPKGACVYICRFFQTNKFKVVPRFIFVTESGSLLGGGKILQRFPEKDWEDVPFISAIELVRDNKLQALIKF